MNIGQTIMIVEQHILKFQKNMFENLLQIGFLQVEHTMEKNSQLMMN